MGIRDPGWVVRLADGAMCRLRSSLRRRECRSASTCSSCRRPPAVPVIWSIAAASSAWCWLVFGVNAANAKAHAMRRNSSRSSNRWILPVAGSYRKFWSAAGASALGPVDVPRNVDAKRNVASGAGGRFLRIRRSKRLSSLNTLALRPGRGRRRRSARRPSSTASAAAENPSTARPAHAASDRADRCQSATRTNSDHSVSRWYSSRWSSGLPGNRSSLAVDEQLLQAQVDCPDRPVVVDGTEQLAADGDELHQCGLAPFVDGQAALGEHAVAEQPVEVERPNAVARHVRVAKHEIHVVDGVEAAEQAAQETEPSRAVAAGGLSPGA